MKLTTEELDLLISFFPPYAELDTAHKTLLTRLFVSRSRLADPIVKLLIKYDEGYKVAAIKAFRGVTGEGLKEAKEAIENKKPITIKKSKLNEAVAIIKEYGATSTVLQVEDQGQ